MKKDTDLDALRPREDFKSLLAELTRGKAPEKKQRRAVRVVNHIVHGDHGANNDESRCAL